MQRPKMVLHMCGEECWSCSVLLLTDPLPQQRRSLFLLTPNWPAPISSQLIARWLQVGGLKLAMGTMTLTLGLPLLTPSTQICKHMGFQGGSVVKNLPANTADLGSISGSGRSQISTPPPASQPEIFPWTKSLAGYNPQGCKESDMTE